MNLKDEITKEIRAEYEDLLRRNEEKHAFLLQLSDAIRPLADSTEVKDVAAHILGKYLKVDRVFYSEIVIQNGIPHVITEKVYHTPGAEFPYYNLPLDNYGKVIDDLLAGRTIFVNNIDAHQLITPSDQQAFISINLRSFIGVPLIKGGNLVAILSVHQLTTRTWTPEEIKLAEETAERTWEAVERARTGEALRISIERLRVTMESAVDFAIITTATDGKVQAWNTGAERIFGFKEEDMKDKLADIIFTPEDRAAGIPQKEMELAIKKGYAEDERWHMRKDGTRFFVSGVMRPIYNDHLTGFVRIARDITQQKLLEQQKDDFIGIASHELKTPITSIRVFAEVLQENLEDSNDKANVLLINKLNVQVDRLNQLVNDLLDTTRIVEGKMTLYPDQFDVNRLIEEKVDDLRQLSKKHRFITSTTGELFVHADSDRIAQVLTNLLSNAIKYSPEGGDITITSEIGTGNIRINVKDRGIGISRAIQDRVFDRFFRAGGIVMDTYPGMGLGLFISAEIIHRHGGSIGVESEEGKGALFYFTLPVQ